jgi:hypothetical protein
MARSATRLGALGRIQRAGFYRGVMGDSRGWMYVWGGLWLVRRLSAKSSGGQLLLSEELKPGQRLVIGNQRATTGDGPPAAVRGRGGKVVPVTALKGRKARKANKELAAEAARQAKADAKRQRSRKVRKAQRKADAASAKATAQAQKASARADAKAAAKAGRGRARRRAAASADA